LRILYTVHCFTLYHPLSGVNVLAFVSKRAYVSSYCGGQAAG
jgi:hypothetical protein